MTAMHWVTYDRVLTKAGTAGLFLDLGLLSSKQLHAQEQVVMGSLPGATP